MRGRGPYLANVLDRVSYHAVYDESIMAALRYARDSGFAGIQAAIETPHLSFERLGPDDALEIADFCGREGMYVSLHAPDDVASLFVSESRLAEGIFNYYTALFSFAETIALKIITLHAGAMTRFPTDALPERAVPEGDLPLYRRAFEENLGRLVDLAGGRFVLCIENYRLEPLILEVLQPFLEEGRLWLCWDLAKTFDARANLDERLAEYFWKNVDRVRQVHLHDIREGASHRVISSGGIRFMDFLPRLAEAEVMDYCIEVRPREKARESLANLKALIEEACRR